MTQYCDIDILCIDASFDNFFSFSIFHIYVVLMFFHYGVNGLEPNVDV